MMNGCTVDFHAQARAVRRKPSQDRSEPPRRSARVAGLEADGNQVESGARAGRLGTQGMTGLAAGTR